MNTLNLHSTSDIDELAWPAEKDKLSLDTPAVEFFTDFERTPPLVLDSSTSAVDAKKMMAKTHVHMLFVLNERRQFAGVISTEDLIDRKIVQKISEGYQRDELMVSDLMRCRKQLLALDIDEIEKATIGEVIRALKEYGQSHCLVLDPAAHRIRGIFSVAEISRKLHISIELRDRTSFYRTFASVA